jgi:Tryptophan-associated transmembrane protein (Trp_oprn_chp)
VSGRRGLATAVLGVAVGAGLVLLGASRVWWLETVPQPAPLRPEEIVHIGSSLAPALPALGAVALAGAGGLLATRGIARRLVGGLLVATAAGAAVLVIGVLGRPVGPGWPIACLIGAVLVGAGGALAVRDGDRWPVMGSRYARGAPAPEQRPDAAEAAGRGLPEQDPPAANDPSDGRRPGRRDSSELWDALDRGEDLTRD